MLKKYINIDIHQIKKNINYLYSVAISQILQKKSSEASKILLEIKRIDSNNPNLYLAKSILDIYNFNPRKAEKNIILAKRLNKNQGLEKTIETVNFISNILNLRIRSLTDLQIIRLLNIMIIQIRIKFTCFENVV